MINLAVCCQGCYHIDCLHTFVKSIDPNLIWLLISNMYRYVVLIEKNKKSSRFYKEVVRLHISYLLSTFPQSIVFTEEEMLPHNRETCFQESNVFKTMQIEIWEQAVRCDVHSLTLPVLR